MTASRSRDIEARLKLALEHARGGDWAESLAVSRMLLDDDPGNAFALRAAATAAASLGDLDAARDYFEQAAAANPRDAAAWEGAARVARQQGDLESALSHIEQACALDPRNADIIFMRRVMRGEMVPAWHFNMMNDAPRNAAFAAAIARQVKRGQVVLEVGAGAGLLAMLAARAGAKHVYTCETNPVIARMAAEVIARNRLAKKITVIPKPSWEVDVGRDLPDRADVLIAEIFSPQLLSEDVIPAFEDAKKRLLKPDGAVIPAAGVLCGALVESDALAALARMDKVKGFDLSPFNAFTPPLMNLDAPGYKLKLLSKPVDFLTFDFAAAEAFPADRRVVAVKAIRAGLCQGVVQWIRLNLDSKTVYENKPHTLRADRTPHWTPLFYPFDKPRRVRAGQVIRLNVIHDRKGARIEPAASSSLAR